LSACLSVLLWALLLFVAAILIVSKQLSVTSSGAEKLQCLGLPREFGSLGSSILSRTNQSILWLQTLQNKTFRMPVGVYLPLISCEVANCWFACSSYRLSRFLWSTNLDIWKDFRECLQLVFTLELWGNRANFFFVSASVFPLNCTTCSILRDVLREMVNKWLHLWNMTVTKRFLFLVFRVGGGISREIA